MREKISALLRQWIASGQQQGKPLVNAIHMRLPRYHRWGIVVGLMLVIIGILLPHGPSQPDVALRHVDPPTPLEQNREGEESNDNDPQGHWQSYRVAAGETLAQLFRDNNLPTESIFAMANVEGRGKPLSNLSVGQRVKIRLTEQGKVTGLTLDGAEGPVLFVRQQDGSFIRAQ